MELVLTRSESRIVCNRWAIVSTVRSRNTWSARQKHDAKPVMIGQQGNDGQSHSHLLALAHEQNALEAPATADPLRLILKSRLIERNWYPRQKVSWLDQRSWVSSMSTMSMTHLANETLDDRVSLRVDRRGGFIAQQNSRRLKQRTSNAHKLTLPM